MPQRPEHIVHFTTLASEKPPRVGVAVAWLIAVGIAAALVVLFLVPWLQTAQGQGQVELHLLGGDDANAHGGADSRQQKTRCR